MEKVLDIQFENACTGQVWIRREGLYYCFDCRFYPPEAGKYRLIAHGEDRKYDLGIFVPSDNGMVIKTRLPVKRFCDSAVMFEAVKDQPVQKHSFIPICADEQFAYLRNIDTAFLGEYDGRMGAYLTDQSTF